MSSIEKFLIDHFGTLFAIFSSIFGAVLGAIWWVIQQITRLQSESDSQQKDIHYLSQQFENLKRQNEILLKMDSKIDVIINDISWLKKERESSKQ